MSIQENCTSLPKVGKPAPDFIGIAYDPKSPDQPLQIGLRDYEGHWLVFFWYPRDFTTICPTEINAFADRMDDFTTLGCSLLGASTDSAYTHRAWAGTPRQNKGISGLCYPLLADQSHKIAIAYGMLDPDEGIADRGLFIISPDGVLQYCVVHSQSVGRSVDEVLRVIYALQSGDLCGSDWKPGKKTFS